MVSTLPRTIQLKLEQTLSQWPHWRCAPALTRLPSVVRTLAPGISNFSVLVEAGQYFVVRIDGLDPVSNGLNRQIEWSTLAAAHSAGLAPAPCYFNPELGSLVCGYLAPEASYNADVTGVGQLLRAIHQLPARHHRLNLAERILQYQKRLQRNGRPLNAGLKKSGEQVVQILSEINHTPSNSVLCHNDLLQANRIYSAGRLWAIDWEYCAMGSPWYDLAVVVNGDLLSKVDTEILITAYLGRAADAQERSLLDQYSCIYRYLELLWYLALETPALNAAAIENKSAALTNLLSQG
ncbi:MAG: phosphotransferase [Halioglobus sp.]|nr:phosphotransferase [Halioglobus sp.]